MRVVVALGGNALLRRGQPMSEQNQRENVKTAARVLAEIAREHTLVITHGNGPQVGLLALQNAADTQVEPYPLDVLGAESEGMIGYLLEQELSNVLPSAQQVAVLLTQTEVDSDDSAFQRPSKPIGPVYTREEAEHMVKERGWVITPDNDAFRRVVPSPMPKRIFEIGVIKLLVQQKVIVICAGGGGIPTIVRSDGSMIGVEAVIDKDRVGALLAEQLAFDTYLMLTDVKGVYTNWGEPDAQRIARVDSRCATVTSFRSRFNGSKGGSRLHICTKNGRNCRNRCSRRCATPVTR